jgi:hypothetical protein
LFIINIFFNLQQVALMKELVRAARDAMESAGSGKEINPTEFKQIGEEGGKPFAMKIKVH